MTSMNRNRYIFADIGLLRSKKAWWIAAVLAVVIAVVLVIVFVPGADRHEIAREYVETLYTTMPEDLVDPTARVEKLRTIATDEVVDHLLEVGGFPAVTLHEEGTNAETYFEYTSLAQDQQITDDRWNHVLAGNIHVINHELNTHRTTWRGAVYFRIDKVDGQWRVIDATTVRWWGP